jgi:hypothetical protein
MTDSKQVLKVELQRLYMTKENEKIVMEALINIHGDVSIVNIIINYCFLYRYSNSLFPICCFLYL